MTAERNLAITN